MPSASRPAQSTAHSRRLAFFSAAICLLAVIAAVVSFANGSWLGLVWILIASLMSNMAWFYTRRRRLTRRQG